MNDVNRLKRTLTLNLQDSSSGYRRLKGNTPVLDPQVLSSPDIKNFKLTTPEVEKFLSGSLLHTPTPSTPSLFPRSTELFSHQFDPLNGLDTDSNQSNLTIELPKSNNGNSTSTTNNFINIDDQQYPIPVTIPSYELDHVIIKEEPQTVPSLGSTPPQSPINMESQELLKLERKRMRNRVAAHKCRKRKLERIAKLEDKVKTLKGENTDLSQMLVKLKEEVCILKQKVMKHHHNGCPILSSPLSF